jgi:hypothetical protein
MDYITLSVAFISGILGVAYPILLQVVTNLSEKYQSENILIVFKQEKIQSIFQYTLYGSISLLVLFIIISRCCVHLEILAFVILYALLIATLTLIIFFLILVKKVLLFFNPIELVGFLIKKHDDFTQADNNYFASITDITISSIKKENQPILMTLTDFLNLDFRKSIVIDNMHQTVDISSAHLNLIRKCSQTYLQDQSPNNYYLKNQMVSFGFVLDNNVEYALSNETKSCLWATLTDYCIAKNDDFLMAYWKKAHSYFTSGIPAIYLDYDFSTEIPKNKAVHDQRNKIRHDFMHFNYLAGALMLHTGNYDALKRIFRYTQTLPESYELLPDTIGSIYKSFIEFEDPFDEQYVFIESSFPFPKLDGLKSHLLIKYAVRLYLALLFIRLYFLQSTEYLRSPLDLPQPPQDNSEKKLWLEKLELFYYAVGKTVNNSDLFKALNFDAVNDQDWLIRSNKKSPLDLLKEFETLLKTSIGEQEQNQTVVADKLEKFKSSSIKLIRQTSEKIVKATNSEIPTETLTKKWYVNGLKQLLDKAPFAQNKVSNHLNFDSFLGTQLSSKLLTGFIETFYLNVTSSYVIKIEDMERAFEQLSLDETYVIISTKNRLTYLAKNLKTNKLSEENFGDTPIISFDNFNFPLVDQSLFILKKEDLPIVSFQNPSKQEIEKYHLEPYDQHINLFGNVMNLNNYPELQQEILIDFPDSKIETSVLAILAMQMEIKWKTNKKVLMLRIQTPYNNRGIPADPKSVAIL